MGVMSMMDSQIRSVLGKWMDHELGYLNVLRLMPNRFKRIINKLLYDMMGNLEIDFEEVRGIYYVICSLFSSPPTIHTYAANRKYTAGVMVVAAPGWLGEEAFRTLSTMVWGPIQACYDRKFDVHREDDEDEFEHIDTHPWVKYEEPYIMIKNEADKPVVRRHVMMDDEYFWFGNNECYFLTSLRGDELPQLMIYNFGKVVDYKKNLFHYQSYMPFEDVPKLSVWAGLSKLASNSWIKMGKLPHVCLDDDIEYQFSFDQLGYDQLWLIDQINNCHDWEEGWNAICRYEIRHNCDYSFALEE